MKRRERIRNNFRIFAQNSANFFGSPYFFVASIIVILIWGVSGPYFHFSDAYQLFINTTTTILTYLVAILIQSTQNRDMTAVLLKLDEILRVLEKARNELINLEDAEDHELESIKEEFQELRDNLDCKGD